MTKAKARQRAKANAGKARKRKAAANTTQPRPPGTFDPGPGSIKSPRGNPHAKTLGASRGAARSR